MTAPASTRPVVDVVELTVDQAQAGFADGTLSAEALTQACLRRIARYDPAYNAIIVANPAALDEARAIDRRRTAGEVLGPLAGIPVVVKDTMDAVGFPTTGGWWRLASRAGGVDLMPAIDAPVVARLKAAGCVILGKTNVPVLSHSGSHANDSWAGPTYNAADRRLLPGGSSAGTATAVAASMAVLGLAEETGGSIQNPASAQGLVGVKPTFALVPNTGVMPLSSNRDVVGPIARSVRDAALCLDVLAGPTMEDPKTVAAIGKRPVGGYGAKLRPDALEGRRLGLYGPGWRDVPLSAEAAALYQAAQDALRAQGAVLIADPFAGSGFAALAEPIPAFEPYDGHGLESAPYDLDQYLRRLGPDAAFRSFAELAAATVDDDPFGPGGVLAPMRHFPDLVACLAAPSRPPALPRFIALKERYLRVIERVFADNALDALVYPQMRDAPGPLHGPEPIHETMVGEMNIAGLPGVTVPGGHYASGAPFGLIIVGLPWSDADLLGYAFAYEQATRHRRAPVLSRG